MVTPSSSEDVNSTVITLDSIGRFAQEITTIIEQEQTIANTVILDSLSRVVDTKKSKLESMVTSYFEQQDQHFKDVEYALAAAKEEGISENITVSEELLDSIIQKRVDDERFIVELKSALGFVVTPIPGGQLSSSSLSQILSIESSQDESLNSLLVDDTLYFEAAEDTLVHFMVGVSKDSGDSLGWKVFDILGNMSVSIMNFGDSAKIAFKADQNFFGLATFRIEVNNGLTKDTALVVVQVNPINDIPSFDGEVSISGTFIDGHQLKMITKATCSDSLDKGLPTPTIYNNWYSDTNSVGYDGKLVSVGRTITLTPDYVGYYLYGVVLCKDFNGAIVADTTLYTDSISRVNTAPVIDTGALFVGELNEDESFSGRLTATDLDGDSIQWVLLDSVIHGIVAFVDSINSTVFNYTPTQNFNGTDSAKVVAIAGTYRDTVVLVLTIKSVNDIPKIDLDSNLTGDVAVGETLSATVACSDSSDAIDSLGVAYEWFADRDSLMFNGSPVASDSILTMVDSLYLHYFYVITRCVDEDSIVVKDTSAYTKRFLPATSASTSEKTLHFDGIDDYIELDPVSPNVNNGITFEFLVKLDSMQDSKIVTLSEDGSSSDISIGVSQESLTVGVGANTLTIQEFFTKDHWTHVAVTIGSGAGNNIHFYKNGALIQKGTIPALTAKIYNTSILGASLGATELFEGTLENVKIWQKVRTQVQIKNNMFKENSSHTDLYVGWSFDNSSTVYIQSTQGDQYGYMHTITEPRSPSIETYTATVVPDSIIAITINGDTIDTQTNYELAETMQLSIKAFPGMSYNFIQWKASNVNMKFKGGSLGNEVADTELTISENSELGVQTERYALEDTRNGETKTYHYIIIDDIAWMAENLMFLPEVYGEDNVSGTESRYYVYGHTGTVVADAIQESNYGDYGVLYNWFASTQSVCPIGWRLPSDAEWTQLIEAVKSLYPTESESEVLRAPLNTYWGDDKGFDGLLFGARAAGVLSASGTPPQAVFQLIRERSDWWSSDVEQGTTETGRSWGLGTGIKLVENKVQRKESALSIRCVQEL